MGEGWKGNGCGYSLPKPMVSSMEIESLSTRSW